MKYPIIFFSGIAIFLVSSYILIDKINNPILSITSIVVLYGIGIFILSKIDNILTKIENIFKKKENPVEKDIKPFCIDEFNEWFKNDYEYDGRKGGAVGIFLRIDKLSLDTIEQYLEHIGQDTDYSTVNFYYAYIRAEWKNKLNII